MSLSSLIIIGIAVCVFLALCIILFFVLYQRRVIAYQFEIKKINDSKALELTQASIQSEEKERLRIATELHDDVGATLASIRLFLYKDRDTPLDEYALARSKELLDEGIEKLRRISHNLQPAILQHLGLSKALQSLIETIGQSGAIAAHYTERCPGQRAASDMELAVYRIAQELCTNIIKHAQATVVSLERSIQQREMVLLFTHNGNGIDQDTYERLVYKKGSTGLKNIVSRLRVIHARLRFYQADQDSYHIALYVPGQSAFYKHSHNGEN